MNPIDQRHETWTAAVREEAYKPLRYALSVAATWPTPADIEGLREAVDAADAAVRVYLRKAHQEAEPKAVVAQTVTERLERVRDLIAAYRDDYLSQDERHADARLILAGEAVFELSSAVGFVMLSEQVCTACGQRSGSVR